MNVYVRRVRVLVLSAYWCCIAFRKRWHLFLARTQGSTTTAPSLFFDSWAPPALVFGCSSSQVKETTTKVASSLPLVNDEWSFPGCALPLFADWVLWGRNGLSSNTRFLVRPFTNGNWRSKFALYIRCHLFHFQMEFRRKALSYREVVLTEISILLFLPWTVFNAIPRCTAAYVSWTTIPPLSMWKSVNRYRTNRVLTPILAIHSCPCE